MYQEKMSLCLLAYRILKPLTALIAFLFLATNLPAQHIPGPDVILTREYNSDNEPIIYAVNRSSSPYTVSVTFSRLQNTTPPTPNPYVATAKPGRTRLVTLRKSFRSNRPVRYHYKWRFKLGCKDTEPDTDIEYLLPIAEGDTTQTFKIDYIGNLIGQQSEDFKAYGFGINKGDTVYAVRRGRVGRMVDEFDNSDLDKYYTDQYNFLHIAHEDCTFGVYRHLKKGSFLVDPGDEVEAGDPIAVVASPKQSDLGRFRLLVMYRNPEYEEGSEADYWNFVVPEFRTATGEMITLEPNKRYVATHPRDLIFQEMNWREKRRWKRRN
ncbi:M23 family metallopeptidase [Gracilimonas mengyeensis]|uniref:Peptidase family M23 n=1 Tax=Gracilimonas mengyeensis TaxID=1302730 RepID=A0A521ELN3_9BACT|nr:M23 family metallopeptidase [Gracilimonas mengyeensis]SMO84825.1 Peptidase family M23 [Gracilimonas mengyeensis]